jgi:hypothetical protein
MKLRLHVYPILFLMALSSVSVAQNSGKDVDISKIDYELFKTPPMEFRGVRWMGFNLSRLSDSLMKRRIHETVEGKLWGTYLLGPDFGPTTGLSREYLEQSRREPGDAGVPYLSEEYFRVYGNTIAEGVKYGLHMSTLYDEWTYPSGIVGGQFYSKYPEDVAKSLDMVETNVTGPQTVRLEIPQGGIYRYVGAVMMNMSTFERVDVSRNMQNGAVQCSVPKGEWKVMGFYLNARFRPNSKKGGFVDYLDKDAVNRYIRLNFDPYYAHLKKYFGTVIKRTIYDEPAMHLSDGRMWTPGYNEGFEKKYGFSPMTLYPAMWYNIGAETAAARNALYGYKAELFAENYIGQVARWCEERGIDMSGHLDQEEARNPVAINGDLMKAFKYQHVPGIDDIYYPGRTNVAYKIVSSAAFNYDRPEVIAETYAAYRAMNPALAMRVALDQLTMGVNIQLAVTGKSQEMDGVLGRAGYLLRGGRHVADIAVVYPIAALQSAYSFSGPAAGSNASANTHYAYEGGIVPPEIDYMDLGERLFRGLRVDYTYLHPEILVEKCAVDGKKLVMNNKINREEFKVLIIPGGDTFSAETAKRVLEFYRQGGIVIATSKLPFKSAEFGRDKEITDMVREIFGISDLYPMTAQITLAADQFTSFFKNTNPAGGVGYFVPQPYTPVLKTVLSQVLPVRDVDIQMPADNYVKMTVDYVGGVTYIHKVKDGRNIYYFVNSTDNPVTTKAALRAGGKFEAWNPHTGEKRTIEPVRSDLEGESVVTVDLDLAPVSSMFFVEYF